ncbi:MAG: class I SAM-dependent methyltransferase [Methanoregula sp.]|nr:class I SAM-dependent methyltransferase [Methanoregula sp.]
MTTENPAAGNPGPGSPSRMAEGIALHRFAESMLPEDVRIFFDPYAIHFIDPAMLAWAREHPAEAKAIAEDFERRMPGWSNSIRARIRYFDDVVQNAAGEGFTQLVIFGAGYDTRAYRIDSIRDRINVFEIDRAATQQKKLAILAKIPGLRPAPVAFVPQDIGQENSWNALVKAGFSPAAKTLFILEGLVMYLPREAVDALLAGIAGIGGGGSAVLFDFIPQSLADGTSGAEGGREIRAYTIAVGEPIRSGFLPGEIVPFLTRLGFSGVQIITSTAYGKMYFHGKNADRNVSGLLSLAYAVLPGRGPASGRESEA